MSSPIYQAIKQLSDEKNISVESVVETIEAALAAAYRKDFGEKNQNVRVSFDPETGGFEVFDVKTVVEDMELLGDMEEGSEAPVAVRPLVEASLSALSGDSSRLVTVDEKGEVVPREEGDQPAVSGDGPVPEGMGEGEEPRRFNPKTEVMVSVARETMKPEAEVGEEIVTRLEVPSAFGRMAAQTAKQVIIQKIRSAEYDKVFDEFKDREKTVIMAAVQRQEGRNVLFDLGQATGMMPPEEQVPGERYAPGDRLKVFVMEVRATGRGPAVIVSRTHPEIVRQLFLSEIPEIGAGIVEIRGLAREAGSRSKVAVSSNQENVDPIGACIGQRGTRIQTIISELGGEKVDIIQYDEDSVNYIANALSPAKVVEIALDEEARIAEVIVNESQLSLAIGRGGQNVRLASKLTGWRINIKDMDEVSETVSVSDGPEAGEDAGDGVEDGIVDAGEGTDGGESGFAEGVPEEGTGNGNADAE